jgi:hypothetical protein
MDEDPGESEVVEVLPECKYDESDEDYMESLFDEFDDQGESGDMDEFLGSRCKYYEKRGK